MQESDMEGKEDLLQLNDFSEESILFNVQKRYKEQGTIFTQIGAPILISVNPYQRLPIFTNEWANGVRNYSAQVRGLQTGQKTGVIARNPGPHLFTIAEDSFQSLIQD